MTFARNNALRDAEKGEEKLKRPGGRAGNLRRESSPQPFTPPSPFSAAQTTFVLFPRFRWMRRVLCLMVFSFTALAAIFWKKATPVRRGFRLLMIMRKARFKKIKIILGLSGKPALKISSYYLKPARQENCKNHPTPINALILYSTHILLFNQYLQIKQWCLSFWCWKSIPTFKFCLWLGGGGFHQISFKLLKIKFCGNWKQSHRECVCSSI